MGEPLKGKIHEVQKGYPVGNPFVYFEPKDIESAVEGLIKYHEDRIEELVMIVKGINDKETFFRFAKTKAEVSGSFER